MMWWIDIDDAIRIYARMLRARLGSRRGAKAAQVMADHLRAKCDWSRGQSLGSSGRISGLQAAEPTRVAHAENPVHLRPLAAEL
jgi:hypothetical protein